MENWQLDNVNNIFDAFGLVFTVVGDVVDAIFDAFILILSFFFQAITMLPDRILAIISPFAVILMLIIIYRIWKG